MTTTAEWLRLGDQDYSWHGGQLRDARGRDMPLRAKSLKMFAALLSERGSVLSKDRLSELVWPETVATDESIARCVADIRKALGDDSHVIVQTYPKQGYRLNAAGVPSKAQEMRKRLWLSGLIAALAFAAGLYSLNLGFSGQYATSTDLPVLATPAVRHPNTVAIIPFKSEGEVGRFLASGLSDDLEIHLAEMSGIRTLSQAQTATIADGAGSPLEIARSLGVRYIVLGNLRQNDNQIALSIQLVDGNDGATLWADRYEGRKDGLISFRNTVPESLVDAMSLELNERDRHRLSVTDTESPEALEEVIHARHDLSMFTYESSLAAEKRLRRAIAIDPGYARAYAELAAAFAIRMENDWIVLSHADTQKALYFADRALELDPGLWFAHYAMGRLHSVVPEGNIDTALHHLETAMELHPAEDDARVYYAILVMMSGRVDEARAILESVIASHPNAPFWYHLGLGNALFHLHEYEEALDVIARCLSQMPNSPYCLRTQMVVQARLGLASDAEWTIEEYALLGYDTSLEAVMKSAIERDPAMLAHLRESYELAGLE